MRRSGFLYSAVIAVAILGDPLGAQIIQQRAPHRTDKWVFGISAFGGIPLGDFRKHENGGGGGELMLGFQPFRREPLFLRVDAGSLWYGGAPAYGYDEACDETGCWTEEVRYNARNHTMTTVLAGPELAATTGRYRPFAMAEAGVTFFNSWANLKPSTPYGPPASTRSLLASRNFATSYGVGIRRVGTLFGRESGFELALRVTRNGRSTYLTEEGISDNGDGTYTVVPRVGAANVAGIHIGYWLGPYVSWSDR